MVLISQIKQLFADLKSRGLIYDHTELYFESIVKGIYIGIDPTSSSLHLGNYSLLLLLQSFEKIGIPIFVLLGDATVQIGDPSFRNTTRNKISKETIKSNIQHIKAQIQKIINPTFIHNSNFYEDVGVMEFVINMCPLININNLLRKDFLKDRLSSGLTLSEFIYPLFQAWDFHILHTKFNVGAQLGGSDQWGNMITGCDIINKKNTSSLVSIITIPLLLDNKGEKFGKSVGGALFLDSELTNPFKMYQYLINTPDTLTPTLLKQLTKLSIKEIDGLSAMEAQMTLAQAVVSDVHSPEIANESKLLSERLFTNSWTEMDINVLRKSIPSLTTSNNNLLDALLVLLMVGSKSEFKRLVASRGLKINGENVELSSVLHQTINIIQKGKKHFCLIEKI